MKKFYTDGSSTIGIKSAHCVTDETGKPIYYQEQTNTDKIFTNNEEEYRGVISALKLCAEGDEIYTDSLLVVNQVSGAYKIKKEHLRPYREEVVKLLIEKKVKLRWIPRDENLAGKHFE